jgi:hypothetical protein
VPGYVTAAGLFTAPSTFQIVGGIDDLASWAGVVILHFLEPLFMADRLHPFKIHPQLDPVGHCSLKLFQLIAGILFTLAAKVDASLSCTGEHLTSFAIGQSLIRTATAALALFLGIMELCCKPLEPLRIFMGGDKP